MNLLASRATGDVILFTDANVMLDMEVLDKLRASFEDPEVGCVCGNLIYTNGDDSVTASTGSLYWRLEESIKRLEQETGSVMGADGSLFALRRSLHRAVPEELIDDIYVSFGALFAGYRVVRGPDVRAFENSAASAGDEFRRKVRISCQAFNIHRRLWPQIRQLGWIDLYKYISHKFLRWLTIYSLALSGLFLFAGLLSLAGWVVALGLAALGAATLVLGYALKLGPVRKLVDVLSAFVATGLGVVYSLRGREFRTWTPAASVRGVP
jgi:cellulose synthase/poly-beta-1,6-N-acetylglucosamine synthase-like glycosyltransferase